MLTVTMAGCCATQRVVPEAVPAGVPGLLPALPRALADGQKAQDVRLGKPKDLDGYFPFTPPTGKAAWKRRAEQVRRQMLVSLGLWPLPTRTPLEPVVHGSLDRGDYTVEKVYIQGLPGFYLTGNLYRPKGKAGPFPGVLCPHGHWAEGRFYDAGADKVKQQIAAGEEAFPDSGRSPLQARCVQMARMGCVVFHYDMIGYADSQQIPQALAHGFAKQRPEMNTDENWGLFSPQAEAHSQSVMGLQTWNSVRALDFLLGLPDIDADRIGVTGCSGGGTQTFILGALDPRVTLSFPVVMVSTAMQGGCTCENASGLRVGTGNVEFAALFAPKPQGMTAANDWTKEMSTKGFPELQRLYRLLGAPNDVTLVRTEQCEHNYNLLSRTGVYNWINRHFELGFPEPVRERDYPRLSRAEMTVWGDAHPAPKETGPEFERKLLRWLTEDTDRHLAAARTAPASFRKLYGGGVEAVVGRALAEAGEVEWKPTSQTAVGDASLSVGLVRNSTYGEEVPVVVLTPRAGKRHTVVWIDEHGKAGLFSAAGSAFVPRPEVQTLLDAGVTVIGADLVGQGELTADGQPLTRAPKVDNPREAAAYTLGYNYALPAQRAHDTLTVIAFARSRDPKPTRLGLIGLGNAGPWVAAARAVCGKAVTRTAVDTAGFRFGRVKDICDVQFLPGGATYGDVPGLLALAAPGALWVAGETEATAALTCEQYAQAGARGKLTLYHGPQDTAAAAAVRFLLGLAADGANVARTPAPANPAQPGKA